MAGWAKHGGGVIEALKGDSGPWLGELGPGWDCGDPSSCASPAMENRCAQGHYITIMIPGRL